MPEELLLNWTTNLIPCSSLQAYLFMTFGAGALLVQVVLLRVMLSLLGECRLLVLGIGAGAVQQLFLALAVRKWQALGAVFLGSFGE